MEGEVVAVVADAGTGKVAEARVESGVVVEVGSYQGTLSAAASNPDLLPENQSVAVVERVDAGQESRLAAERDHLEESQAVGKSGFDQGNQSEEGTDTLADPGPIATL